MNRNELLGLAGNVKITNPDDTLSRNGQWPPGGAVVDAQIGPATADVPDSNANKRFENFGCQGEFLSLSLPRATYASIRPQTRFTNPSNTSIQSNK